MKKTQRMLAVGLAIALLAMGGLVPVVCAEELALQNGGFDSGLTGWSFPNGGGEGVSFTDTVRMGESGNSMKVCSTIDDLRIQPTVDGILEENAMYTIGGYVKVNQVGSDTRAVIRMSTEADNWGYNDYALNTNYNDGKWHYFKRTFFASSNTKTTIWIRPRYCQGYELYFDNFSIVKETNLLAPSMKFIDEDFEMGALDSNYIVSSKETSVNGLWTTQDGASYSFESVNPISGNYSLKVTTTTDTKGKSGPYFPLKATVSGTVTTAIEDNTPYKLSFKTRAIPATEGDEDVQVTIRIRAWQNSGYTNETTINAGTGVELHEIYFTPDVSDLPNYRLYFNMNDTSNTDIKVGDSILFDELRLEPAQNALYFQNAAGEATTTCSAGAEVNARLVRVMEKADSSETVQYIIARYIQKTGGPCKLDKLEKFDKVTTDGIGVNAVDTSITVPAPSAEGAYVYKAFVWNSLEGLKPLSDAVLTQKQ